MKRWPLIVAFLLTFAAGGVAGGMLTARFVWHKMMSVPQPAELAANLEKHLRHELELSPEQIDKIRPIIQRHAAQAVAFHREIFARIHRGMEELSGEIAPELTPAQQEKQNQLKAERIRQFPMP